MIKQIFFDVDGTLISKDEEVRPGVLDVMRFCHEKGLFVVMWSGGGTEYAKKYARKIDPNRQAHIHVIEKTPGILIDGHIVIDDMKEVVSLAKQLGAIGYWVPFFEPMIVKDDNEMYRLKEFLKKLI